MAFKITWDDYPEAYDSSQIMEKLSFEPEVSFEENHILLEGDNYPVLKLLQKNLQNKVNLIYIDPPYNTGNEFTYNDSFIANGDRHSAWLSFMSRRLKCAARLLQESGCIFIAIDQSELYVLKLLCDQIFGEDNFVNDFMWLHGKGKKDTWSRTLQQHTLCYAKNKKALKPFKEIEYTSWAKKNVDKDPRGAWFSGSISFTEQRSNPNHHNYFTVTSPSGIKWTRQWQCSKEEMDELLADNKIYFGPAPEYAAVPRKKVFNDQPEEVIPRNIIEQVESTRSAQKHLDELLGAKAVFDNPKPVDLISHLIEITQMPKDSIILDFFAGSGTTFEAVCELNSRDKGNRKCILVQKPEEVKGASQDCDFKNIAEICKARCQNVSQIYNEKLSYSVLYFND